MNKRASALPSSPTRDESAARREGELLVRFRAGVSEQEKNSLTSAGRLSRARRLRGESGLERLVLPPGQDVDASAVELRRHAEVELAEPNYLVSHTQVAISDPRFQEQWALRNTGQTGGQVGSDINAAPAWRETTGARSTIIAVIDSGIDFSHPDLKSNEWENASEVAGNAVDDERNGYVDDTNGWDWVTNSGVIRDEQGHGTAVAGIIAAEGNNGLGITGVMWRASLMSLRVLDATGTGDVASAVEAIDYAVAHGAQVINCSWGTQAASLALRDAIERAGRHGAVVVTSAGNASRDIDVSPYYPASFDLPNLISVASTDQFDNLASFSDWGATRVALAAPGVDILTTRAGGDYWLVSGTSASAPLVSGICGLLWTLRPNLPAAQIRNAVVGGARRVPTLSGRVSAGGVADAAGSLGMLNGNPYAGNSGGAGNGNGQGHPYVPPALGHEHDERRANGLDGLRVAPPAQVPGAPGENLPNLDESRRRRTSTDAAAPSPTIQSSLMCASCDSGGGGGAGGADPYFGTERATLRNRTGRTESSSSATGAQENLGSRNFNWGAPIVELKGRAGLDLSLALSYNSLVWTKQGSSIEYNADHGTPAPGFQLGFPRLQAQYLNATTQINSYLLITPAGGRTELRQVSTGVYEAADGSYAQLTFTGTTPVVRTTDGTQYRFEQQAGAEWRCTLIEDRNGNYIGIAYYADGRLNYLYDTLLRRIDFNYYADGNLQSVTQAWGATTHTYATFNYASVPMSVSFPGLAVYGLPAGGSQTVLSSVALSTGESYQFDYNSYGQVYQVRHKAPDGHELAHTFYNLDNGSLSASQSDCPRFTERHDYAENWNNNQEAVTTFAVTNGVTWTNPETGATESGTLTQETLPDGTTSREYAHASGWDAGLTRLSEMWSGGTRRKWTSISWTQDNTSLGYPQNPRLAETNIYDAEGNRRRTTYLYTSYNLPSVIGEWGGVGGQTLLRQTNISYNLDASYLNQRIIGLVAAREVYDGSYQLVSKTGYSYDSDALLADTPAPTLQHDPAYNRSLLARGNLVAELRYDLGDIHNANGQGTQVTYGYDTAGSRTLLRDALSHQTSFSYADNFSDGNNARSAFAYVTKVTDADGYQTTAQYNYDYGAVTNQHYPTGGTGAGVTFADEATQYDTYGRLQQVTRLTGQQTRSYKRWVYETNASYVHTYETIIDTTQANEFHSWSIFDGAGRVRASAADHPGSAGGYAGQYFVYDQLGRLVKQSKPTEINAAWTPTGDDAAWVSTQQAYDWKGRPTQTTNPDGTTRLLTYGGCGCAGGEVVTAQDEHGRQRRETMDGLGRRWKVEELNWDGSIYATTTYSYDARDQLTGINQQGQTRTFEYDTKGRLWHETTPEQGTTTYTYNADDTLNIVTDARGATATYHYETNNRHLVSSISYGVANGVAATPDVSYGYDAAAHRTQMIDGQGATAYHYDGVGRLDYEDRTFTGVGTFHLSYGYNAADELTTFTNHWGAVVNYSYDRAGRIASVGGLNYAGLSSYASALTYRAFGALKTMSYGNGLTLSATYDSRLRPTAWNVAGVLGYSYDYNYLNEHTGRVTYAHSLMDATLDRSYEYDQSGRLAISHAGAEARAHVGVPGSAWGTQDGPYSQGYDYDVWGNVTRRYGWGGEVQGGSPASSTDIHYSYTNNRRDGFSYDAAGNLTNDLGQTFAYDAAGHQVSASYTNLRQGYDGDGLRVRKSDDPSGTTYYLRSSVLGGQVVAEIRPMPGTPWGWSRGYVYLGMRLLAVQQDGVYFVHEDPVTKSKRVTDISGGQRSGVEADPFGADTSRSFNTAFQPRAYTSYERDANGTDEAMMRRYNRWHSRFDQPDPYGGSYNLADPQSFNRYSYTQGDPVNSVDPSGLLPTLAPCYLVGSGDGTFDGNWAPCSVEPTTGGYPGQRDPSRGGGGAGQQNRTPPPDPSDLVNDCRIRAMLDTVAFSEGTAGDPNNGYGTLVRGTVVKSPNNPGLVGQSNVIIDDFSQHPNATVRVGRGLASTAAGRYQILNRTWNGLGLPDFSPRNQDIGAVMLMQRRGMVDSLLNGDFPQAVRNGNREWASLPGSPYGQGTRGMDELQQVYNDALNNCLGSQNP